MYNKIQLTDSYEKFAISNMRDYILNEELYVFRNCVDAIEEISSEIFAAADLNHMISGPTSWSYNPELKRTVNENENLKLYKDGFKIFINYQVDFTGNWYMAVADRRDYPNQIMIDVNVAKIKELSEIEIRSKLKHEFGHIRQNYGIRNYDISHNGRFVDTDYQKDIFKFPDECPEDVLYDVIDEFMYIFSPVEIQQRYNELYQYLIDLSTEDLEKLISRYKKRNMAVAFMVENTNNIHLLNRMKQDIQQIKNAIGNQEFQIPLIIAYYFKRYGMFKTSDEISVQFVQNSIDEIADITHQRKLSLKFHHWLEDVVIRKYIRYIHTIVHYILYSRLWEFDDRKHQREYEDKINKFVKKLKQDILNIGVSI